MTIAEKLALALHHPLKAIRETCLLAASRLHNALFAGLPPSLDRTGVAALDEIHVRATKRSDINEHLALLYIESILVKPRLIVELGTRGGESTFVLERVAAAFNSELVSVDITPCSANCKYPKWHFVNADDVQFAREFPEWCSRRSILPEIDILLIDTSHFYGHTKQEIAAWFPLLSERAKVFFHDTHLQHTYMRQDGSMEVGWQNRRGVIRAIEEYFGDRFDEKQAFITIRDQWIVRHQPSCAGMTILQCMEGSFLDLLRNDRNEVRADHIREKAKAELSSVPSE